MARPEGLDPTVPEVGEPERVPGNLFLEVVDGLAGEENDEAEEGDVRQDSQEDSQPPGDLALLKPHDDGQGQDGEEEGQREGEENGGREPQTAHHDDHQCSVEEEPGSGILLHPLQNHGSPS